MQFADETIPAMDERIEMVTQLYNAFRSHVAHITENAAQVATGRFQWLSDDEEEREVPAVPANHSIGPRKPLTGVIDVNSVREQLQNFSMELCGTYDFNSFKKITMSNLFSISCLHVIC